MKANVVSREQPVVQLRGITKLFPGVQALKKVDLNVENKHIHGLIGENGAGKTTLLRILCGIYVPNEGEIFLRGDRVSIATSTQASLLGIGAVHQELSLCPSLSVAENVFFGRQPVKGCIGLIDRRRMIEETKDLLDELRMEISPMDTVGHLSLAEQQEVEILKALAMQPSLLLLDEPTSTLSGYEIDLLFNLLNELRENGVTILYVSHKIHELMDVCDRISVLRDGKHVKTITRDEADEELLVHLMTGRQPSELYPGLPKPVLTKPKLEIRDLSANVGGLRVQNIDLKAYAGEIVGIAGLVGSGRTEMAATIFGIHRKETGTLLIDGEQVRVNSPCEAIEHRISYIPEDRRKQGLFLRLLVPDNVVANELSSVSVHGFVNNKQVKSEAGKYISAFDIKVSKWDQIVGYLSGGNQQKILLARFLATSPEILIVDEPTRGIDVGAKREIHFLLRKLADKGTAILMISSELEEILGLSNRIYVMYGGEIICELQNREATEEIIIQAIVTAAGEKEPNGTTTKKASRGEH